MRAYGCSWTTWESIRWIRSGWRVLSAATSAEIAAFLVAAYAELRFRAYSPAAAAALAAGLALSCLSLCLQVALLLGDLRLSYPLELLAVSVSLVVISNRRTLLRSDLRQAHDLARRNLAATVILGVLLLYLHDKQLDFHGDSPSLHMES